jgi:shikimate kinase
MAKNLDIVSYDLDRQVSKYAKLSVSDIFTLKGERHFRNLESSCLSSVLAEQCLKSEAGFVIALGGGAFAQKSIRDTLNMYNVFSIYIDMDRTTLFNRIKDSKTRPLISSLPTDKAKLKKMNEIINSRLDTYKKADITLKIHGELKRDAQLDKLFNAIVNWYEST